jgi:hypothetical protein
VALRASRLPRKPKTVPRNKNQGGLSGSILAQFSSISLNVTYGTSQDGFGKLSEIADSKATLIGTLGFSSG